MRPHLQLLHVYVHVHVHVYIRAPLHQVQVRFNAHKDDPLEVKMDGLGGVPCYEPTSGKWENGTCVQYFPQDLGFKKPWTEQYEFKFADGSKKWLARWHIGGPTSYYCLLLATYYLRHTTYCLLLTTYDFLLITY